MMQQPTDNMQLARIERQLDKLDEITRLLATRADLENLRKEVVQTSVLEPQLSLLRTRIEQLEKRIDEIEKEQVSRSDRLIARLGPAIAGVALLMSLIQFLGHYRFVP